jgi:regulatory protein
VANFGLSTGGRNKIIHALESKGLSKNCIRIGLKEIEEDDYLKTLDKLVTERASELVEENTFIARDRISKSLIQKGYEPELVWKALKKLLPD